jgi:hypothetical protein
MSKKVIVEGKELIVPDDATPDEIDALYGGVPQPNPDDHDKALSKDTGFWAGVGRGATGLVEGARAALEGVDPTEPMGAGVARIAVNLGKGMKAGIESEAEKAGALMDVEGPGARGPSGRGLSSTGHMIAAAVPGVGPYAANLVERGASGDVSGAIGEFIPGLLASEIPRAAMGAVGKAARVSEARTGMRGAMKKAMDEARISAAAREAAEVAEANKAGLDLQEWMRVDRQTPEVLTNKAVGLKTKDFKKGYEPTSGAMRTGVVENFDQPPTDILGNVNKKFDELSTKKGESLRAATEKGVKAAPDDILNADDIFQPILERAAKQGNKGRVRKIANLRRNLLEEGGKDLTPEGIQKHLDLVDSHIGDFPEKSPIRRGLEKYRKQISSLRDRLVPEGVPLNQDMRDLTPVKRALKDKIASEKAAVPDESTLKPLPMREPAVPAPGQDIPPELMERIKNMTPAEKLKLFAEGGEELLPWYLRVPMRLGRKVTRLAK